MSTPEPTPWQRLEELPPDRLAEVLDFAEFLASRDRTGQPNDTNRQPRTLGLLAGKLTVPDDFDDPLPDDVLNAFYQ
ncbi:MAG: DUF2281 domain-containing protein [Micrococcales bacterium]|nr:DUF2281 domain-containing protein [Micrococcales bacterium]